MLPWLLVLVGGAVGVVALASRSGEDAADTAEAEHAKLPSVVTRSYLATNTDAACRVPVGTRLAYDIDSETEVEIDFSRASESADPQHPGVEVTTTPATSQQTQRRWHLDLVSVAEDADSSVLAARIHDLGVQTNAPDQQPSPALADTFLIRVGRDCGIREFGWRSDGDLDATREQQIMSAALDFSAPAKLDRARTYTAMNSDATGRYAVSYRYEDGRIEGEIAGVVLADLRGRAPIEAIVGSSNIEVELAAGRWFASLTNERDLALEFGGEPFGHHFRSTRAQTGRFGEHGSFAPRVDLDDGGWSWGRVRPKPKDSSESFDPALRELPLDDMLTRYRSLIAGETGDHHKLLRDWLRANPEQTPDLLDLLRAGEFEHENLARAGVFYALGSANTDAAKQALVDILDAWPDSGHQIAAARALAMVEQPTAEMIELVAAGVDRTELHPVDRGSMALALGAVARTSAERNPEVAALARERIGDWLAQPSDAQQLGDALLAAGNAGHVDLLEGIAAHLDDESPKIRGQATHAMRQMPPERVAGHLATMVDDPDASVRTRALETAASVARASDQAPSETLVELAGQHLETAVEAEQRAAISLLSEAGRRGDAQANEVLRAHLRAQLDADGNARDPQLVAAIARGTPGHWRAAN